MSVAVIACATPTASPVVAAVSSRPAVAPRRTDDDRVTADADGFAESIRRLRVRRLDVGLLTPGAAIADEHKHGA